MAEKDNVYKGKLKNSGIFNFNEVYNFLYDLISEMSYDISETTYTEKVSGDSKDIDICWKCVKKISDYFKFEIKMEWELIGIKNIKVKRGDKEISANSGSLEIKFSSDLVKDYESRWEDNPVWKFLRGVYDRYIIKSRISEYEDKLFEEVNEIISQSKSFLVLEAKR